MKYIITIGGDIHAASSSSPSVEHQLSMWTWRSLWFQKALKLESFGQFNTWSTASSKIRTARILTSHQMIWSSRKKTSSLTQNNILVEIFMTSACGTKETQAKSFTWWELQLRSFSTGWLLTSRKSKPTNNKSKKEAHTSYSLSSGMLHLLQKLLPFTTQLIAVLMVSQLDQLKNSLTPTCLGSKQKKAPNTTMPKSHTSMYQNHTLDQDTALKRK